MSCLLAAMVIVAGLSAMRVREAIRSHRARRMAEYRQRLQDRRMATACGLQL